MQIHCFENTVVPVKYEWIYLIHTKENQFHTQPHIVPTPIYRQMKIFRFNHITFLKQWLHNSLKKCRQITESQKQHFGFFFFGHKWLFISSLVQSQLERSLSKFFWLKQPSFNYQVHCHPHKWTIILYSEWLEFATLHHYGKLSGCEVRLHLLIDLLSTYP